MNEDAVKVVFLYQICLNSFDKNYTHVIAAGALTLLTCLQIFI